MDSAPVGKTGGGFGRFVPIALFVVLAAVFYLMLTNGKNAHDLPTALAGKQAPAFALPPVDGLSKDGAPVPGFTNADLKTGKVTIVNVFGSWCGPCRDEHPQIMTLAADPRVTIKGINQKDRPADAARYLGQLGNPYSAIGADSSGRVSIDWGVYGVPETFIVKGDGTVTFKKVGPISVEDIEAVIKPEIEKALK
jgi:cytochrome c biogenesis protein CcmG, thiol:disulfide interchange protein DsbE